MDTRKAGWMAGGVALLGLVAWLWPSPPATAPVVASREPAQHVGGTAASPWCSQDGQRRYALTHQSQSYASVQADETPGSARSPGVTVDTSLEGVLVARCLEAPEAGVVRVAFLLSPLTVGHVLALGQEVLTAQESAALTSTDMVLDLRPDGTLVAMRFGEPGSEVARNVLQVLWSDLQVRVAATETYASTDETVQGRVVSDYLQTSAADAVTLERHRSRYEVLRAAEAYGSALPYKLEGNARFTLERGLVSAMHSEETVNVQGGKGAPRQDLHSVTTLRLLASEKLTLRPPARVGGPVVAGRLAVREDFEARTLALRVDGLTMEQLKEMLLKFANGGQLPDHNRTLWRATGLLRAHPELLAQMEQLFHDATMESRGRQLVLDLLVGTGTPQAQAVLRNVLASRTAQQDPNYGLFYQRLGLVASPDEKTVLTASEHYRAPGPEGRQAAVYAYGAVLGNRLSKGDAAAKGLANGVLKDLKAASSNDDRALLLMALGNAGVPEQSEDIMAFTTSENAGVRRAAANALRKDKDPQVTSVLVGMVSDQDVDVQRRALLSLSGRAMDAAAWNGVTAALRAGRVGEAALELLLDVVSAGVHMEEARRALEAILDMQPPPSVHVLGRAREMLAIYQVTPAQLAPGDLDEPTEP